MTKIRRFSRLLSVAPLITADVGYILPPMSVFAAVSAVSAAVAVVGDVDEPGALLTSYLASSMPLAKQIRWSSPSCAAPM
jgi:hypothetical protein